MIYASDFMGVLRGKFEYLFFVVTDVYWFKEEGPGSLNDIIEKVFSRRLGRRGAVVASYSEDREKNFRQLMRKEWPDGVRERLRRPSEPKLLVIAKDFSSFNPVTDPYIVIDFAECGQKKEIFLKILEKMETVIRGGRDLFQWWETEESLYRDSWRSRLFEATDLKLQLWFFSFNPKKLMKPD